MKAWAILIVAALVAVGLWWGSLDGEAVAPVPVDAPQADEVSAPRAVAESSKAVRAATDANDTSAAGSRQVLVETMTVVGRCVSSAGKPLASVPLRLSLRRDELEEPCWEFPDAPHVPEPVRWQAPKSVVSAADGTFSIRLQPTRMPLRIDALERFAVDYRCTRLFTELQEELVYDTGDLVVREGFPVSGSVVDQYGQPISATMLSLGGGSGCPLAEVQAGRVDFGCAAESSYMMECCLGTVTPSRLQVGPEHDTTNVRFVVHRLPVLSCLVVDDRTGEPVPVQRFEPELREQVIGHGQPWTVYANDEGRLWIRGNLTAGNAVRFGDDSDDPEPTHYVIEPDTWYDFRDKEVLVRVRAWPTFLVEVLDAGQQPVKDFDLAATVWDLRLVEEVEPGTWKVSGVRPGRHLAYAYVEESPFAVSPWRSFDPLDHAVTPLQFTIAEPKPLRLQVRTVDGTPIAASMRLQRTHPDAANDLEWFGGDRWSDHAATDAQGKATLQAPADLVGWQLYVSKTNTTKNLTVMLNASHQAQRFVLVTVPAR